VRLDVDRAGRLAPHDHRFVLVTQLARLEAQARVEAGEALDVGERLRPPLLVVDEQQRDLRVELGAGGERAQRAQRDHDAALHVDRAGADELLALAPQRLVLLVRDDGVDVAEQEDALAAAAVQARDRVLRMPGRRARDALDLGLLGKQQRAHRDALLGAGHVARRARHADQRLELARDAMGQLGDGLGDPRVHGPAAG
jgi:hypothetical protein